MDVCKTSFLSLTLPSRDCRLRAFNGFAAEGQIPTVYQFNLGLQTKLPYGFRLDVSYVGSQSRHLLQRLNINAIPYGALYLRQNQDPTRFAGGVVPATEPGLPAAYAAAGLSFTGNLALPTELLRPYRGYGRIDIHQTGGNSNYNSMQVALERRFVKKLFVQTSYTWSKALGLANPSPTVITSIPTMTFSALMKIPRRHFMARCKITASITW